MMESKQAKHVLIVDDSQDQQMLLKMLLEAKGYTAECTPNGKEALDILRSRKEKPQIILLDLNMKVMSGFEFRQLQCADPQLREIPVIVVSGEENSQDIREKMNSDVLTKPLSISSLMAALERNMKLH